MLDWKHYKNTVKSNVLEGFTAFMAKKRVNYRLFDWKHWKNTVKNNVLEGFLIYIYVGVGYRNWNMEKLKKTL